MTVFTDLKTGFPKPFITTLPCIGPCPALGQGHSTCRHPSHAVADSHPDLHLLRLGKHSIQWTDRDAPQTTAASPRPQSLLLLMRISAAREQLPTTYKSRRQARGSAGKGVVHLETRRGTNNALIGPDWLRRRRASSSDGVTSG